jgi:hypothetical protein
MKTRAHLLLPLFVLGAATVGAIEITLPAEKAWLRESPLPGYALANALCYTCHSIDYVLYQPPASSRAYWTATVLKMKKAFGAPIPDSAQEPLVEYLVKNYGAEKAASQTPTTQPVANPTPK